MASGKQVKTRTIFLPAGLEGRTKEVITTLIHNLNKLFQDIFIAINTSAIGIYGGMGQENIPTTITIVTKDVDVDVDGMTSNITTGMTFQNGKEFKIATAGKYQAVWSISFNTASGAKIEIEGVILLNGTRQAFSSAHRTIDNNTDTGSMCGTGIITCAVDDIVKLAVHNQTNTTDVIIAHSGLTLCYVGA